MWGSDDRCFMLRGNGFCNGFGILASLCGSHAMLVFRSHGGFCSGYQVLHMRLQV